MYRIKYSMRKLKEPSPEKPWTVSENLGESKPYQKPQEKTGPRVP
jgi:hypothetical protein